MTRIEFRHGAADKLDAACRLVHDAYKRGSRIVVFAPDESVAARIDRLLWTQPAIAFIPHCVTASALAAETPVLISAALDDASHDGLLINLDRDVPPGFGRFEQLIEIVNQTHEDRDAARKRYKFYRDRGYPLAAQDLASSGGDRRGDRHNR